MHVGPVSSASALTWIGYARSVLDRAGDVVGGAAVPAEVVQRFTDLLDAWQSAAEHGEAFSWEADVDPDELEFLAHAFLRVAEALADEAEVRGSEAAPAGADEFYQALVSGVVGALEGADRARAEFAEQLRQSWPGLQEP